MHHIYYIKWSGVHNFLVHSHTLPFLSVKREDSFPVTNLQTTSLNPKTDLKGTVLRYTNHNTNNKDNNIIKYNTNVYAIVHQYDRWDGLTLRLAAKYVYWADYSDEEKLWMNSTTCHNYDRFYGEDLLKGQCDLKTYSVVTYSGCCSICNKHHKCTAYAYTRGKCFLKSCSIDHIQDIVAKKWVGTRGKDRSIMTVYRKRTRWK